jgi:hypothetical protein
MANFFLSIPKKRASSDITLGKLIKVGPSFESF